MNAVLHQLKWDFRRIRTLWILWIILLAGTTLGSVYSGPSTPNLQLGPLLAAGRFLVIYLAGILLVGQLMYSTPFCGSHAFWKTRPLGRSSLFWTKSILIVGGMVLPAILIQIAGWQALNAGGRFVFWASLYFTTLTLAVFLFAAGWAARCERWGGFLLGVIATGGGMALLAILFNLVSDRLAVLPLQPATAVAHSPTTSASTLFAMIAILFLTAAAAWLLGTRWDRSRAALGTIVAGITIAAGADNLWRLDFLRTAIKNSVPEITLPSAVLAHDESVPPDHQLLWNQLSVKVNPKQTVHASSWHATFTDQGGKIGSSSAQTQEWYEWDKRHQRRLRAFYPEGTRWLPAQSLHYESLVAASVNNTSGQLQGAAQVTLYEWQLVASLPVQDGASTKRRDGMIRLRELDGLRLTVEETIAPPPFGGLSPRHEQWHDLSKYYAYVTYHEASGTASLADRRGTGSSGSGPFGMTHRRATFEIEDRRWPALTGIDSLAESGGSLRLDLYEAVPVGTDTLEWDRDRWTAYHDRSLPSREESVLPKPTIARNPLPDHPTPEQIDAFLDGILFSLPDHFSTSAEFEKLQDELRSIGPEHLARLLARLPVGTYARELVYRVIRTLATETHKPALLDALVRDPGLAELFRERGWTAEAAPVLARLLAQRRPLDFSTSALAISLVASQADPATFDDLRWHFLNAPYNQRAMAQSLSECPGFPFEEALAELWAKMRYDVSGRRVEIAPLAARLGDKEALRIAFLKYVTDELPQDLQLVSEAVEHPGGDLLPGWLHENFDALVYNPASRRFELR